MVLCIVLGINKKKNTDDTGRKSRGSHIGKKCSLKKKGTIVFNVFFVCRNAMELGGSALPIVVFRQKLGLFIF